ncbi:MAG: DUF2141 domain-containing protein [Parasphingorhabdus sp.]
MLKFAAIAALSTAMLATAAPAYAGGKKIGNDLAKCQTGNGPAVLVKVNGLKAATGKIRVQSYRGVKSEWLKKGRWLHRIDIPVTGRNMTFCMPIDQAGTYGIAVRHDINGNGKTEISKDGGGMSNNPSINIFNLGKPSYKKTAISVGNSVKSINIRMRYL